jgi:exonuclease SbcC
MKKTLNVPIDEELNKKSEVFTKRIYSNMHYKSELGSDSMDLVWLGEIEFACPYIDNIIRNPKLTLINEEDVVKIEKAKKITVESVKDLSKHTHFIDKIDPITEEVKPSKILVTRREETFNTYENRFIYTLITNLSRFVGKKEATLEGIEAKNDKVLEYAASTNTDNERVTIELKIGSKEMPKGKSDNDFANEIELIKERVKKIRSYISGWQRSEFISSLDKAHVPFVFPPIRKTNMILKNPNFQIGMKLWEFLNHYDDNEKEGSAEGLDTTGNDILKDILNDSFLMNYFVLDSISKSKKEQKEKLCKYAVIMIHQQIQRAISLLLNNGIKITDEQILSMVANSIDNEKDKRLVGSSDVKKKFKNAMDEYLEKAKDYL